MTGPNDTIDVCLEVGTKRVFAEAVDWPGWCRSGRDADAALAALADYGPRYARVLGDSGLGFQPPADAAAFHVVERLDGNATTDFGAPGVIPAGDARPADTAEVERLATVLEACWRAFDAAVAAAEGKELRKGPRGGGRELEGVVRHVAGSDAGYVSLLGAKVPPGDDDPAAELERTRATIREALAAAARGEAPPEGPRGGKRWPVRYFVRRSAWHVLDHAWELEDRIL